MHIARARGINQIRNHVVAGREVRLIEIEA